ncbi:glycosyltransferase family 4 protein [Polynucleobacter sp. 15G-AUS-farblos]|uniref:glycosyltransferase family 4 protein n=1 Tax=Polynucleobacter sp. 15G-AUS-farblos TaxID=2689094 RepID=UPI001C0BA80B|nr:glycosyltransferase family 4 protein [Polynucleobacter sp. 15G-AUS-farblos]MBU3584078.1 glycosyltransferase family 4 protein [Polynucleobacter sp. 15G-AUS-farblos]
MYPPIRTGTSFYTQNLAKALKEAGHTIKVITPKNKETEVDNDELEVLRIPALKVPLPGFFKHFRVTSLFPRNYSLIDAAANNMNADVILLVNHYLDIAFPAIYAAKKRKIPLFCSIGTQLQSLNPYRNKILKVLDQIICGYLVFPSCRKIIAWDKQIEQYLIDTHGNNILQKTEIVNYGVNGNPNFYLKNQHDYQTKFQILGVGAVSEQRSFIPLVKAFALIATDFPNLHLKIIGHIYYDEAVKVAERLNISDRITFAGELSHNEVLTEMMNSDVFYSSLTGQYVGLGTATIESMLVGLPTIVNCPLDILGNEKLSDMVNIIHCPGLDPKVIAVKLKDILANPDLRKKIGGNGRDFVIKNMSWIKVSQDMTSLFKAEISPINL